MDKIKITEIDKRVYLQKGYDGRGCYNTKCEDKCCLGGCDVDKESYDLIFENRTLIESELGINLDKCFRQGWSGDKEFLGGDSIWSEEHPTKSEECKFGLCIFHIPDRKCCVLYKLVNEKSLPRRLIPTICRLYPLNWDKGKLYVYEDIEPSCNCSQEQNKTKKNAFEIQKHEIDEIFEIECPLNPNNM